MTVEARVGTLPEGARFVTTLTGRGGRVLLQYAPKETTVAFDDAGPTVQLHPDVSVRVVEAVH